MPGVQNNFNVREAYFGAKIPGSICFASLSSSLSFFSFLVRWPASPRRTVISLCQASALGCNSGHKIWAWPISVWHGGDQTGPVGMLLWHSPVDTRQERSTRDWYPEISLLYNTKRKADNNVCVPNSFWKPASPSHYIEGQERFCVETGMSFVL